jgi:hypothetical protein
MRPDKKKVVDEVWDEDRIRGFLDKAPMGAEPNADYSALLNAYRAMRPDDFARFLTMFTAAGRDLNARSRHGQTLLETIAQHETAAPFRALLKEAGATS